MNPTKKNNVVNKGNDCRYCERKLEPDPDVEQNKRKSKPGKKNYRLAEVSGKTGSNVIGTA